MSKKFFSLIHGDKVHIAPKTKIITAEAISTLQSAEEILQAVRQDAEHYKKEIVSETESLKEHAQREGFEEGYKQWSTQIAALEQEIAKVRQDMERLVLPVAIKAAKKIVNRELDVAPEAIVDIVAGSLKAVAQHKQITIYVNKKDLEQVEANRPRLKQLFESLEALSIRERANVERGGCVIETEAGIINAQLDNRWRILESAFDTMKKPQVKDKEI